VSWRYRVFDVGRRRLPRSVQRLIRRLPVSRFRMSAEGDLMLATGPVDFEGKSFSWTAPFKALSKAQESGIEARLSRMVASELGPGSVALDVGSSYGFVAHVMAIAAAPGGRVVAFEADPATADTLRATAARNHVTDTLSVVTGWIGDTDDGAEHITVDAWVREAGLERLDVLLIDTDGGDLAVLRGAAETVERFHPVLAVEITADQETIYQWLADRYELVLGMAGQPVVSGDWPANLVAANHQVRLLA
jgi:precorrin-6B methylase 2